MKQKLLLSIILILLSSNITLAQKTKEIIKPKGNLYLGVEIGTNTITSFSNNKTNKSFQEGLLIEYYFAKQWSALARVKYFETGVSFVNNDNFGEFNGSVISIPIDIKWEFRIYKNLKSNLKIGGAYNFETKANYIFSTNLETNNSKSFVNFNTGIGLNYFLSKKTTIYIDFETYKFGGYKGNSQSFILSKNYYTENNLINIGIKYNLKK
ncbi:outer membrane beta-barrel protein [Flavobacterium psychrophilum]|uniref:outer membrane beta-barrel protein n=1 Tax=Flavobacterium psychrophilum TaxID=96345 RepID=UPI00106AA4DC|nr:outer membrane beta-barrel protein [Flavobacterium psychrophilum]